MAIHAEPNAIRANTVTAHKQRLQQELNYETGGGDGGVTARRWCAGFTARVWTRLPSFRVSGTTSISALSGTRTQWQNDVARVTVLPPYAPLLMYAWSPPVNATLATGCASTAQRACRSAPGGASRDGSCNRGSGDHGFNDVILQASSSAAHHLEDVCHELRDRIKSGLCHVHAAACPIHPASP